VLAFDRIKVDDPVGALSVHLVNGVWGTLALGIFYDDQIATDVAALATGLSPLAQVMVQLKGILYVGAFTFVGSLVFWYAIKLALGVRVAPEEELEGLDVGEHGSSAYPDFALHPSSLTGISPAAMSAAPAGAARAAVRVEA
jgi:Amt family ammonium transporter